MKERKKERENKPDIYAHVSVILFTSPTIMFIEGRRFAQVIQINHGRIMDLAMDRSKVITWNEEAKRLFADLVSSIYDPEEKALHIKNDGLPSIKVMANVFLNNFQVVSFEEMRELLKKALKKVRFNDQEMLILYIPARGNLIISMLATILGNLMERIAWVSDSIQEINTFAGVNQNRTVHVLHVSDLLNSESQFWSDDDKHFGLSFSSNLRFTLVAAHCDVVNTVPFVAALDSKYQAKSSELVFGAQVSTPRSKLIEMQYDSSVISLLDTSPQFISGDERYISFMLQTPWTEKTHHYYTLYQKFCQVNSPLLCYNYHFPWGLNLSLLFLRGHETNVDLLHYRTGTKIDPSRAQGESALSSFPLRIPTSEGQSRLKLHATLNDFVL